MQANASFNARRDTVRGMHYQAAPHVEAKLVRCVSGAIWDVAIDLRPDSPAYCRWTAVELSAANRRALHVPEGVAHGFQTLTDACEVHYLMSAVYVAEAGRGVRWDDPAFAIEWPAADRRANDLRARQRVRGLRAVTRVLVTGGGGFIGREVVPALASAGHRAAHGQPLTGRASPIWRTPPTCSPTRPA